MSVTVTVGPIKGIDNIIRSLRFLDKDIAKEVSKEIRHAAALVRDTAVAEAMHQGFAAPGRSGRGTGALIGSITYSVKGGRAWVVDKATRRDYPYPAVFEFGQKERWMVRPFLKPAVDKNEAAIKASVVAAVERAVELYNA